MAEPEPRNAAAARRRRRKEKQGGGPKTDTFAKVTWIEEKVAQSRAKGILLGLILAVLVYLIFPASAYETVMATDGAAGSDTPTGRCA